MAGIRDSSLTRVEPAFAALDQRTDRWREELCSLGSRAEVVDIEHSGDWAGVYTTPPQFEYSCRAPLDYLEFLVNHATDSERIDQENLRRKSYGEETVRKRRLLFEGDADVRAEALRRLRQPNGRRTGRGQWHVLEGATKVDCALFSEQLILFVEGKRTEPGLTDKTEWYRFRHQVIRNLDCLRAHDRATDVRWFVLLAVEDSTHAHREAIDLDDGGEVVARSVPHLTGIEVEDLWSHYLGYVRRAAAELDCVHAGHVGRQQVQVRC